MSQIKHTPAPWAIHWDPVSGCSIRDSEGELIACTNGSLACCIPQEANAYLISQAPEMYALIKRIEMFLLIHSGSLQPSLSDKDKLELSDISFQIDAVMTYARGEI